MCWNGKASAVLATVSLCATAYAAYKKEPTPLWLILGYFSLMEMLQAFTYLVINECSNPANQIATVLGYLHIAFQPFFINALSLYFIPERISKKIAFPVYTLCFASAIYMILQLYPFDWAGTCQMGRALCGPKLCSVSGNWHIAWELPFNGIGSFAYQGMLKLTGMNLGNQFLISYGLPALILPLIYGSWRFTLYHWFMGPFIANLLTNNANEWPAIWCLLSIGFLMIVVITPVRKVLFVKDWWLWPGSNANKILISTSDAAIKPLEMKEL